jgi:sugar lactone lactonase YvrE
VFAQLPAGSVGNGIRVAPDDRCLYVADYTGHAVLRVDLITRAVCTYAADARLHQPNDLAITADGMLFASDPDWTSGTGRVWRVDGDRGFQLVADDMGTTNGIEVSPDGRRLYVNESLQRRIWVFQLDAGGALSERRLFAEVPSFGLDGMRFGPDGLLYVARYGKGTIARFRESGEPAGELRVLGCACTNLAFVGDRCVVTSADRGNLQILNISTCMIR